MVIHSNRTGAIISHLLYSLACFALVIGIIHVKLRWESAIFFYLSSFQSTYECKRNGFDLRWPKKIIEPLHTRIDHLLLVVRDKRFSFHAVRV